MILSAFMNNWKLVVKSVIVVSLFVSGWLVNGWRLEANYAELQIATTKRYEEKQKLLNAEFIVKLGKEETARLALSQRLTDNRSKTASLEKKLANATLAQSTPNIERVLVPGECVDGQTTAEVVIANPFSADFVELWNSSAGGIISRGPATPEAD